MLKFFKKNKGDKPEDSGRYINLKIKEIKKETDDAVTVIFEKPAEPLQYKPGQFLTLILPIDGEEVRRSYSLSSSPFTDENPAVTVKRVDQGKASNYINDHLKPGDTFKVMKPAGHFVVEPDAQNEKTYILFAAGSGITPVMSIIKSVLAVEPKSTVLLIYQNRHENSIIFKDELEQLEQQHPGRFTIIHFLSRPSANWQGRQGHVDGDNTKEILSEVVNGNFDDAEYYVCGPEGFMHAVLQALEEQGIPGKQIHRESFYTADEPAKKSSEAADDSGKTASFEVTILLDGEEYKVQVPPEKTILEAALDENIDMPFSCQSGVCTACRGKLLEGELHRGDEDGLSNEEIEEGYVLNCVSRPAGPGVKVEIG